MEQIEGYTEFLLRAAFRKCGNLADAEDLTQETLLAGLHFLAQGGQMEHPRTWLLSVLSRKFCDLVRRRHRYPVVSVGEYPDSEDDPDLSVQIGETDEGERVRREVAFLAETFRQVIVRHYMEGQSVREIAQALNIPEGTVKSRLSAGRMHIKKGMEQMEHYGQNSYNPVRVVISNSGMMGAEGVPASLVDRDLIAQNLLYLAYRKPVPVSELAKEIGIPMPYVEPIVARLTEGELMRRCGERVYTDFILYTEEDRGRFLPAQRRFADRCAEITFPILRRFYEQVRLCTWYREMEESVRNALEWFCFMNLWDYSLYGAFSAAYHTVQDFPQRKDGGRWIAFGNVYTYRDPVDAEWRRYLYTGQNNIWLDHYLGADRVRLSIFCLPGLASCQFGSRISPKQLLRLLYIIGQGIAIEDSGFDEQSLTCIPWLVSCGILHCCDQKPHLNIPLLYSGQMQNLDRLLSETQVALREVLCAPLADFLKDKKKEIPEHLKSVPLQKQYLQACQALPVLMLEKAVEKEILCYNGNRTVPAPMILVVDH